MSSGISPQDGGGQDFELNLASIIDCFTVLIAFMLASASFLSIGILDAGVAAAGATASDSAPPPVNVLIELKTGHAMAIKVSGKETTTRNVGPGAGAAWDEAALTRTLGEVHSRWPAVNAVTLQADNTVEYRDIVRTMEVARQTLPVVLLGGF